MGIGIAGFAALAVHVPFVKSMIMIVPVVMLCGIPAYAGRFLCRFFPADWPHLGRTLTVQAVFIGMSGIALVAVWLLYVAGINLVAPDYLDTSTGIRTLPVVASGVIVLLAFAQIIHYLALMLEEKKRVSEELLAQKLATSEAELVLVKSTIHPHFLFNSLSMLKSLVRSDPVTAEKALEDLSEFLMYSVQYGNRGEVPFEDEIAHARHYAAIERLRGINDFTLTFNVPDACRQCMVLPFIVQPLIENALKHGIRQCPAGGEITVHASVNDPFLRIAVTNPLPPEGANAQRSDRRGGTGLKTLEKRLFGRYGAQAKLDIQAAENEFSVTVKIPLFYRSV
jgi:LytS/YehU family sensor histidine kinase